MPDPVSRPPKVLISYSHDSEEHADKVLSFSDRLRAEGVDAIIDQYEPFPEQGWTLWMKQHLRDSDFVLMVCTETYRRRVDDEEEEGCRHGDPNHPRLVTEERHEHEDDETEAHRTRLPSEALVQLQRADARDLSQSREHPYA